MAELILALDVPDAGKALAVAEKVRGLVPWVKIGLELFMAEGPDLLALMRDRGFRVFLDLKFYDIPNTVKNAVLAAKNAQILTLHCQGGKRMCEAALEAASSFPENSRPLLFGVTVLTSFADGEIPGITKNCGEYGTHLASLAASWGLDGVVCSGHEAGKIKKENPGLLCLCPGIRPEAGISDDQRRTMTPERAVAAGADFLVVGRPILKAADPRGAASEIIKRMLNGF